MPAQTLELHVNHRTHAVAAGPTTPLLQVLRGDLNLKGAKHACGLEQCGACKVLVDGRDTPSCMLPVREVVGKSIETVEGLARGGELDPLQRAFIAEGAIQCGYCVAGMLMTGKALLARNSRPSTAEIREAIHRNLCRCGVYPRVIRAIQRAAGHGPDAPLYAEVVPEGTDFLPCPQAETAALPASLQAYPNLDDWFRFSADGVVDVFTGKVELGQGITTALAQVAAEELDVALARIRIHTADTALTPDEGATAGSMSLEVSGGALRQAAAEVRYHLLTLAAEELEAPLAELTVVDGSVRHEARGRAVTYWRLLGDQPLGVQAAGVAAPKASAAYRLVGQPVTRLDIEDKVRGRPVFLHDMHLPGMLHGRVIRGPYAGARRQPGIRGGHAGLPPSTQVVEDGEFLAVLCAREDDAICAMERLAARCTWRTAETLPSQDRLYDTMLEAPGQTFRVVDGLPVAAPIPPLDAGDPGRTVRGRYDRPYHMHAALGPSCGVARYEDGTLTVWSHSQGVFQLRDAIAQILKMPRDRVRVIHAEGPGCYGHNGADDAAFDACLLALRVPGRPVRVQWSRRDEFVYEPYGTAMVMDVVARLDPDGHLAYWRQSITGYTHMGRPEAAAAGEATLLGAWSLAHPRVPPRARPSLARHVGLHRNGAPQYRIDETVVVKRFLGDSPLRVSSMRALGAYANVFAIESTVDDLARLAGADPLDFRLRHLEDPRGQTVLRLLAARMGWQRRPPRAERPGRGWGVAYSRYKDQQSYVAIGVILNVDPETGTVRLEEGHIASDSGQIVNPDGLSAQLEGAFIQSASWTLHEEVKFSTRGVTSTDWEAYPILRATQTPRLHTYLVRRDGHPAMGAGEAAQCPVPAAIANAIHDAVGIRLRTIPFTPNRIRRALAPDA